VHPSTAMFYIGDRMDVHQLYCTCYMQPTKPLCCAASQLEFNSLHHAARPTQAPFLPIVGLKGPRAGLNASLLDAGYTHAGLDVSAPLPWRQRLRITVWVWASGTVFAILRALFTRMLPTLYPTPLA
jgi:hypothetical protein